jgi:hypothetical protein
VEPRGFEPLTSAVQSRHDTLLQISGVCETAASTRIPHTTLFLGFRTFTRVAARLLHKKGLEQSRYLIPVYHYCCPRERLA